MNLFFDLDGTLADPFRAIGESFHHTMDALGRPRLTDAQVRSVIGPPLHKTMPALVGDAQSERAIALYREHHQRTFIENYSFFLETDSTLQELAREHVLFVVTSKPTVFAKPLLEVTRRAGLFRGIYGSELDGTRGDKAELIRYILEREPGVTAQNTVMIGDREHDVIAASKNAMRSIGVLWGYGSREELAAANATRIAEDFAALLDYFAGVAFRTTS